jgi:hypothetical protein
MNPLRCLCLLLAVVCCSTAQTRATAEQAVSFVQSMIKQKLDDGAAAKEVAKLRLTTRLDPDTVTSLQRSGAGPKTVAALTKLAAESAGLPAAAASAAPARGDAPPTPSPAEQQKILNAIRDTAMAYTENLPNYICTQVTERKYDPTGTGDWHKQDTIQESLSYNDHQESYKVVMINDRLALDKKHEQLGGAVSSGEFGSIMRSIFDPRSETEFEWNRLVRLPRPSGERVVNVLAFKVNQHLYTIHDDNSGRTISVGYHGFLWADRETSSVLRIKFECDGIPADFPIQSVALDLNYDFVEISGQQYALPLVSDIRSHQGRYQSWNQARYANYRKFGVESTLSFDTPAPVSTEKLEEKPVVKKQQ